jgi:hypothetical protein
MAEDFYYDDTRKNYDKLFLDEDGNEVRSDNYVYPNQREVARNIVDEWKNQDGDRMVLLKAQMQAGKTGVIRHICYLLNVQKEYVDLKIDEDNVHVLCNLSDNALVRQTRERLEGVMIFPAMNVNHPAVSVFTKDDGGKFKKLSYIRQLQENRVLIIDESHYGTGKNGRIASILASINSPLHYDRELMKEKNVYVLLVSATPFSELGINTADKKVFTLQPAPSYYGIHKMIEKNRIYDSRSLKLFNLQTEAEIGVELEALLNSLLARYDKPGFIIIRENIRSKASRIWVALLKKFLDNLPKDEKLGLAKYGYFDLNQETATIGKKDIDCIVEEYSKCVPPLLLKRCLLTASKRKPPARGIDAVLCYPPDHFVFVFVKEMLLAGKTLDTSFVRMVVDIPYQNPNVGKVDRLLQGLVGRCCGVGKEENIVFIVSDMARILAYRDWLDGKEAPVQASVRATRSSKTPEKTVTSKRSAYVKGGIESKEDFHISFDCHLIDEDEEPIDDDDDVFSNSFVPNTTPVKTAKPPVVAKEQLKEYPDDEFSDDEEILATLAEGVADITVTAGDTKKQDKKPKKRYYKKKSNSKLLIN